MEPHPADEVVRGRPADLPLILEDLLAEIEERRSAGALPEELERLTAEYRRLRAVL